MSFQIPARKRVGHIYVKNIGVESFQDRTFPLEAYVGYAGAVGDVSSATPCRHSVDLKEGLAAGAAWFTVRAYLTT